MKTQSDYDQEMIGRELTVYPPKSEPPVRSSELVLPQLTEDELIAKLRPLLTPICVIMHEQGHTNLELSIKERQATWKLR